MAPEIVLGLPYEGKSIDVFAAGVILFNMVTRGVPFQEASNTNELYTKISSLNLANVEQFWQVHSQG